MEALRQCYAVTDELIQLLKESTEPEIAKIDQLLEKRQACLSLLTPPKTESEKKLGSVLLGQDKELLQLLRNEKLSIQKEIKELKHKKVSNQKYVNPYQALNTDGVFYDKRK